MLRLARVRTGWSLLMVALAAGMAAGCLLTRDRSQVVTGRELTGEQISVLKPGETTRDEIIKMFGAPTWTSQPSPEAESLIYTFQREDTDSTTVFLLWRSGSHVTLVTRYHFELRNAVLERFWIEESN